MTGPESTPQVHWISTLPASERFYQRSARSGRVLTAGGLIVLVIAAAFLAGGFFRLGRDPYFAAGVGGFLVVLGVLAVLFGRRVRRGALLAVGISTRGLTLRWKAGDDTILLWEDPSFRVKIQDMRDYQPAGTLDSFLTIRGRSGGLTTEACEAILMAAKAERVSIVSRPWRGSWGEVGRYELGPRKPGPLETNVE